MFEEDWVQVRILGNALESYVRHGLVDEVSPDASLLVAKFVVIELRREQPLPGDGYSNPASVDGDPAPAPLLRDVSRRPRTARRIKDEVAWVGGHQHATADDGRWRLNDI
jgi:hypothetical protein